MQAGLEDSDVSPNTHSDVFDHSTLKYQDGAGDWVNFPYSVAWIDYPCGVYSSGYCLDGYAPSAYQWLDGKQ